MVGEEMIKCEVVFDGNDIHINGCKVDFIDGGIFICKGLFVSQFDTLEQAITYCLEN